MELIRSVMLVMGITLLAGCSIPPAQKQALPDTGYLSYAANWVGINRCVETKQLSPDTGSLGLQYARAELSNFTYDAARLEREVIAFAAMEPPSAAWCSSAAMNIATKKRRIDQNNADVEANKKK
jgi:hypothetical protein